MQNIEGQALMRGWRRSGGRWVSLDGETKVEHSPIGWRHGGRTFDLEAGALASALGMAPPVVAAVDLGWVRDERGWTPPGEALAVQPDRDGMWRAGSRIYGNELEALAAATEVPLRPGDLAAEVEQLRGMWEEAMDRASTLLAANELLASELDAERERAQRAEAEVERLTEVLRGA